MEEARKFISSFEKGYKFYDPVLQKAADAYKEALRMRRRQNDWRRSLGEAYAKLGKVREAEQKYREILALSPDDDQALHGLQALGKRY